MAAGRVIFGTLALLGLWILLTQVAPPYLGLKAIGGLYLIYLGIELWRSASQPIAVADKDEHAPARPGKSFGLATQLGNPKTAVVNVSIFAALLPARPPLWMSLAFPVLIFIIETGWHTVVVLLFSAPRLRTA